LLTGKGLLTPIQESFLALFASLPDQGQFYLTGGTALAEFYLGHRLSYDLDFFTGVDGLVLPISYQVEGLASAHRLGIRVIRRLATYVEFTVEQGEAQLRVDLALDSPFHFKPTQTSVDGVQVNSYVDLCVDKLLAYYGRAEPRDAIDLYFILQREQVDELLQRAAQKDPGFDLYWFSIALQRSAGFPEEPERWPVKMLVEWNPVEIKNTFAALARQILSGLEKGGG
jgi:hypothetical protein